MYFALMTEKPAAVGEAADVLAARLVADVGTVVLVHVFAIMY